jgi:hypothetical protein
MVRRGTHERRSEGLTRRLDPDDVSLSATLVGVRSRRQMVQRMGRILRRKPDGRLARFIVLYVEATIEDPAKGAHEGFLEEITSVADSVTATSSAHRCGRASGSRGIRATAEVNAVGSKVRTALHDDGRALDG